MEALRRFRGGRFKSWEVLAYFPDLSSTLLNILHPLVLDKAAINGKEDKRLTVNKKRNSLAYGDIVTHEQKTVDTTVQQEKHKFRTAQQL